MKTTLGVGISVLSALAAQGKDFDRTELNAMLDKLAASPEPKAKTGPMAMCYSMAVSERESFDYVCKKCGKRTHYPENYEGMRRKLAFYRDSAVKLRGMGLNVVLDESALCRQCTTLKALGIPTTGVIVSEPKSKQEGDWVCKSFGLRIGDAVAIKKWDDGRCRVRPRNPEYWISEKFLGSDGCVTGNDVWLRYVPLAKGYGACRMSKGAPLSRLDARPGDPAGWVRVEAPMRVKMTEPDWYSAYTEMVGQLGYEEGKDAHPQRIKFLAWVINGKRTIVDWDDVELLTKFLSGKVYYDEGNRGPSVSMKSMLPRLRELLGDAKK